MSTKLLSVILGLAAITQSLQILDGTSKPADQTQGDDANEEELDNLLGELEVIRKDLQEIELENQELAKEKNFLD